MYVLTSAASTDMGAFNQTFSLNATPHGFPSDERVQYEHHRVSGKHRNVGTSVHVTIVLDWTRGAVSIRTNIISLILSGIPLVI